MTDRTEELGTEAEDHAADAVRYAVMSRPFVALLIRATIFAAEVI